MNALDQKGLTACAAWSDLIAYIADHPKEPIPMAKIRPAVESQADYTIALSTDMIAHLLNDYFAKWIARTTDHAQPDTPPDAP